MDIGILTADTYGYSCHHWNGLIAISPFAIWPRDARMGTLSEETAKT